MARIEFPVEPTEDDFVGEPIEDIEDESPDEEEIHGTVKRMMEEAEQYYQEHIEPEQVKATDYYMARPFGNEKEGRSKVVSTDVRDAMRKLMPSVLRVFTGPDRVVEFRARGIEDIETSEQITDYISYVIREDNPGFLILHSAFKDTFLRKLGVIKMWNDDVPRTVTETYTGLSEDQIAALSVEPGVEVEIISGQIVDEMTNEIVYEARVTKSYDESVPRFEAIPPEEFRWTPSARSLEHAPLVAHTREVPGSDLVAMGIDPEIVEEERGKHTRQSSEHLEERRTPDPEGYAGDILREREQDDSTRPVLFTEAYVLVDVDGSGVAQRRMFQCVGPNYKIVNGLGEQIDSVYDVFADFSMDPEPHTVMGLSVYDYYRDVQLINSQVLRGTLNSLALAVDQKTEIVEGEVNVSDLTNTDLGGFVRVRKPGMMREIKHTFVGDNTLPFLEYYNSAVKEEKLGLTRASMGLDADALQSATKQAVAGTFQAAQANIELIIRILAETGMRKLYKGLLKLVVRHQNRPRVVRLRGKYVEMDPSAWDISMDVQINDVGAGSPEEKVATLMAVLTEQKEQLASGSPLVSLVEYRRTLSRIIELGGYRFADEFFRPWGPDQQAQLEQQQAAAAQQPPPMPPEVQAFLQVEQAKLQAQAQKQQTEIQLKMEEMQARLQMEAAQLRVENDRERDKMAREFALKQAEIEAKYKVEVLDLARQVDVDRRAQETNESGDA
jgi:hypothetical protein